MAAKRLLLHARKDRRDIRPLKGSRHVNSRDITIEAGIETSRERGKDTRGRNGGRDISGNKPSKVCPGRLAVCLNRFSASLSRYFGEMYLIARRRSTRRRLRLYAR